MTACRNQSTVRAKRKNLNNRIGYIYRMVDCPLKDEMGCDFGTTSQIRMYGHVYDEHIDDEHTKEQLKELVKSMKFPKSGKSGNRGNGGNMADKGNTGGTRPDKDSSDFTGIDNLDEVAQLKKVLDDNGIKKSQAIANLFQYHDLDDLKYLQDILRKAGIQPNTRSLVLETWASIRELGEDEIPVEKSKKSKTKSSDDDDDDDEETALLKEIGMSSSIKDAMKAAKRREAELSVARRLKAMNMDPKMYGLPDVEDDADKTKSKTDADDEKIEIEWPPDTGKNMKVTPERYNQLLLGWNKAHGKLQTETTDSKDDTMVPWVDPLSGTTINVPAKEYQKFANMSLAYQKQNPRNDPVLDELRGELKDAKKTIDDMKGYINKKEYGDLAGAYNNLDEKFKKQEQELEQLKHQDPMDLAAQGYNKLMQQADKWNLGPKGMSTQEQIQLKKTDMQVTTIEKALTTISDRIGHSKVGSGEIANQFLNNNMVNGILRDAIRNRKMQQETYGGYGGQQVPVGDDELVNLNQNLMEGNENIQQESLEQPQRTFLSGNGPVRDFLRERIPQEKGKTKSKKNRKKGVKSPSDFS